MEKGDLAKLQVLIVGGKPHAVMTLRTVFGIIGLNHVTAVAESERAVEYLCDQSVDAVFCDESAAPIDRVPFPLAARRKEGMLNPMLPIFMVCGSPRRHEVERARDDGVTDILVRPVSAATVIRKLRVALAAPRPFILAGSFFGPDRRGAARAPFRGEDRRSRVPKKLKVTLDETAAMLSAASAAEEDVVLVR